MMEDNIEELIIHLQDALDKKYGRHFKKFYLTKQIDNDKWEGLISSSDEEGRRNAEYYSINEKGIIKDNSLVY